MALIAVCSCVFRKVKRYMLGLSHVTIHSDFINQVKVVLATGFQG